MKQHNFSKSSLKELKGIHPLFSYLSRRVLDRSKYDIGIPVGTGGFRTAAGQLVIFKAGNSKCDGVKAVSAHQLGLGLDFVIWIDSKMVWPDTHPEAYMYVATLFLEELLILKSLAHFRSLAHLEVIPPNIKAANLFSGVSFDDHGHLELRGIPAWRKRSGI